MAITIRGGAEGWVIDTATETTSPTFETLRDAWESHNPPQTPSVRKREDGWYYGGPAPKGVAKEEEPCWHGPFKTAHEARGQLRFMYRKKVSWSVAVRYCRRYKRGEILSYWSQQDKKLVTKLMEQSEWSGEPSDFVAYVNMPEEG